MEKLSEKLSGIASELEELGSWEDAVDVLREAGAVLSFFESSISGASSYESNNLVYDRVIEVVTHFFDCHHSTPRAVRDGIPAAINAMRKK